MVTFGEALRKLLYLAQIKQIQLADYLDYDVSYISRWINDIKRPSMRQKDDILNRISTGIIYLTDEKGKFEIISHFDFLPYQDDQQLVLEIMHFLDDLYTPKPNEVNIVNQENNAIVRRLDSNYANNMQSILDIMIHSCQQLPLTELNIISIPTRASAKVTDCSCFWNSIIQAASLQKKINLKLVLDTKDCDKQFELYRDLCMILSGFARMIDTSIFYSSHQSFNQYSWICKDTLYITNFTEPITQYENAVIINDRKTVNDYYGIVDTKLQSLQPLIHKSTINALQANSYFQRFLIADSCIRLSLVMTPILMEKKQRLHLGENSKNNQLCFNEQRSETLYIYESSITDYIFNGVLQISGKLVFIDRDERILHLETILNRIGDNDEHIHIIVLRDNNPILPKDKMNSEIILTDNDLCILNVQDNYRDGVYHSDEEHFINQFHHFFKDFASQVEDNNKSNNTFISIIKKGLDFLKQK